MGFFASTDSGATWSRKNELANIFLPGPDKDDNSSGICLAFKGLSGSPSLTVETPSPGCTVPLLLGAMAAKG